ncbi:hypothetical protein F7725_020532 [Dissostichus mawsoni]|uniref:G-protein coupled receptors family 1 profile domain-containing protein n=1 Tax=Dissostichus mawsoni TaxID=36200 RepID=A0A7J5YDG2_DISMA|nr:hypothetical protein F7725_020532 [Dissostichus mawsoni]
MVMLLGPLAFIVFSYCCIIIAVLKIANVQGRIKSLSTCSTQLIIISLYYLPRCFVYLASNVGITFSADVRISIMAEGNQSTVTEFILTGFPGLHPEYQDLVSAVLFFVYFLTMAGNVTILLLFATDHSLHKPMYYIILNLCTCDILFSTTTLPKIISKYWFHSGTISFTACFVQMFFVHYLGTVNSYILFLMALDRYLAVCHPLKYPILLNNSTLLILSITAWVVAHAGSLMMVIRAYPLPYCASNIINHCYCDHIGITILACTDRAPYGFPAFVFAMVTLLGPLAFIVFSYCCIIIAVLKIANVEGRIKSLSTCSTQLIIISLYYLPRCFVYLASNVGITFSADVRIVIIMMYSLCPPMINPFIYCLRAKDMRESLRKQFKRRAVLKKAHVSAIKGNQSTVTEFILTGFPGLHPEYQDLVSAVLFFHNTLPKIISKYWFHSGTISFTACFVQMFFVHYLGTVNSYILFLMALDRYLAVCHPLKYPILNNSTLLILSITAWVVAHAGSLMMVIRAYPLPYCASNIINHCYCDHIGITILACTDRAPYGFPAFVFAMVMLLGPLAFILSHIAV